MTCRGTGVTCKCDRCCDCSATRQELCAEIAALREVAEAARAVINHDGRGHHLARLRAALEAAPVLVVDQECTFCGGAGWMAGDKLCDCVRRRGGA